MKDTCDWCGEEVNRPPSHIERTQSTFCDNECQGKWESNNKSGSDSYNWKGGDIVVECIVCGESRKVRPATYEKQDRFFCSHDCYGQWRSKNVVGENHPQWSGGDNSILYKGSWNKISQQVRDEYSVCTCCGMENEEHIDEYGFGLHIHHIEPYTSFDDPEEANQKENLVPLCVSCHRQVETEDLTVSSPYENT